MGGIYGLGYITGTEGSNGSTAVAGGRRIHHRHQHYGKHVRGARLYALLTIFVTGIIIGIFFDGSTASASSNMIPGDVDAVAAVAVIDTATNPKYETVEVQAGDSLWLIAKRHSPEHLDIRDYIAQLKQINGLTGSILYEGMLLRLP